MAYSTTFLWMKQGWMYLNTYSEQCQSITETLIAAFPTELSYSSLRGEDHLHTTERSLKGCPLVKNKDPVYPV